MRSPDLAQPSSVGSISPMSRTRPEHNCWANRAGKSGQVTVNSTSGATGRYIIVWFTDAPLVADGRYRAMLSEITVSG